MTKATTPKTQAVYLASDTPGGFLPSVALDRANAFASMRLALEAALAGDRNAVSAAVRDAAAGFPPELSSHRTDLLQAADRADALGRPRDLETVAAVKISFFEHAESGTLTFAPKHPDAFQIHAAKLAEANKAEADKYRVRHKNY